MMNPHAPLHGPLATVILSATRLRGYEARHFHGCKAVAPLKQRYVAGADAGERHFHGCKAVAPLKHRNRVQVNLHHAYFHGCKAVAPLKLPVRWKTARQP